MSARRLTGYALALLVLAYGAARFFTAAWLPATRGLTGDFSSVFPTQYFVNLLRPDFSTAQVWKGWNYGPMLHFLTLPLFLVPRWSMVPAAWAAANLAALTLSFVFACRLASVKQVSWAPIVTLAGLWLLFQPLGTAFVSGDIEMMEMTFILGSLIALQSSKARASGALLGMAAMMKLLPIGFLGWFLLRRQWRAFAAGVATIVVVLAITTVTLGWKENHLAQPPGWLFTSPMGGLHELSVTSMFLHRAGVLDYSKPEVRWFPSARALAAAHAGALASLLLAVGFGLLLVAHRRRPVSPFEIAILFMTMFMIPPWNHDYYYIFALVPMSLLFLHAVAARDWTVLTLTIAAYLLISPPVPFSWVDRTGWFALPFAYVLNFHDVPVLGAFILWSVSAHQLMRRPPKDGVPADRRGPWRRALLWAVPAGAVVVLSLLWFGRIGTAASPSPSTLSIDPALQRAAGPALALSPDGRRLAYIDERGVLCTRPFDQSATVCWPEAAGASGPFFSPDSRSIGFFVKGALKKVLVAGGAVRDISGAADGLTGSWDYDPALPALGRQGTILFASPQGICRILPSGGDTEVLIPARAEDGPYLWPNMLPSGETVLFTIGPAGGGMGTGTIVAHSLTTGRRSALMAGSQPHFDRKTRQLLYTLGGRVLAVAFTPEILEGKLAGLEQYGFAPALAGVSIPLAGSVLVTVDGGAHFAVSDEGTLVYVPGSPVPVVRRALLWVDRQGSAVPLPIPANAFETPRLSPDGRSVAAAIRDVVTDVWVYDRATGTPTRLSAAPPSNSSPVWAADGRSVAFAAGGSTVLSSSIAVDGGPVTLWKARAWDSREPVRLSGWSRDGHLLAGTQRGDLWLLDTIKAQAALIQTPFTERDPVVSPDGRWIAYSSDRSGRSEIYVQSYPELGVLQQVTDAGEAVEPLWSRDGRELFYRRSGAVMAMNVTTGPAFAAGPPRRLFEGNFAAATIGVRNYDVSPDAQYFVMVSGDSEPQPGAREIRVLRGWPAKLPH